MRRPLVLLPALVTALVALVGAGPAAVASAAAAPTGHGPTEPAIRRALARAQGSSYLWATVNVCVPRASGGGVIGIRGEMPALGFASTLSMTIALSQYRTAEKRYVPVPGATATRTVTLGREVNGVHQGGAAFQFASRAGRLEATVTFTWTRAGHRLGTATATTVGGHPSAANGQPAHHSAAACAL